MSLQRAAIAVAVLSFSLLAPASVTQVFAGRRGPQQFGEVKPDKALVYFIRTSRFNGSARTQYLYADQTFLGVVRNGSYSFAYVDPGEHLLWTNWTRVTKEVELVAGQTYYVDVWLTISLVDEARGKALIEEVGDFVTPTEGDMTNAASQIENRYERAKKKEARKEKAEVAPAALSVAPPESTEGMLQVPANTPATLELLENVCSSLTATGDTVWFRASEDAAVEGGVFLKKDTLVKGIVREAVPAQGGGKEGALEIVVPALMAPDGSSLPTIGLILSSGEERGDASLASGSMFGVLGALAVRGREAYHFAGEKFKVFTRQVTWIRPDGRAGEAPLPAEPVAAGDLILKGQVPDPVKFKPRKGKINETVDIDLDSGTEPREVVVFALGGSEIPEPIKPLEITPHGKGWRCTFKGWDLARYMREQAGSTEVPVKMRGALQDGKPFVALASVNFSVDRE